MMRTYALVWWSNLLIVTIKMYDSTELCTLEPIYLLHAMGPIVMILNVRWLQAPHRRQLQIPIIVIRHVYLVVSPMTMMTLEYNNNLTLICA